MATEQRRHLPRTTVTISKEPTNSEIGIQLNQRQLRLLQKKRNRAKVPPPSSNVTVRANKPLGNYKHVEVTKAAAPAVPTRTAPQPSARQLSPTSKRSAPTKESTRPLVASTNLNSMDDHDTWSPVHSDHHMYARTAPTAPSTSWADSASSASASSSIGANRKAPSTASTASGHGDEGNEENQAIAANRDFYGQGLKKQEKKKLYDDTGATWDSKSGVSSASTDSIDRSKQRTSASFADRRKVDSYKRKAPVRLDLGNDNKAPVRAKPDKRNDRKSMPILSTQRTNDLKRTQRKHTTKPPASSQSSASQATSTSSVNESEQKAFLRKMMSSYAKTSLKSSKSSSKRLSFTASRAKKQADEAARAASGDASEQPKQQSKGKSMWSRKGSNRQSLFSSGRSNGSSGLGTGPSEKAMMRKVLARAVRKTTNPRTKDKMPHSSRMRKLLSPRGLSPRNMFSKAKGKGKQKSPTNSKTNKQSSSSSSSSSRSKQSKPSPKNSTLPSARKPSATDDALRRMRSDEESSTQQSNSNRGDVHDSSNAAANMASTQARGAAQSDGHIMNSSKPQALPTQTRDGVHEMLDPSGRDNTFTANSHSNGNGKTISGGTNHNFKRSAPSGNASRFIQPTVTEKLDFGQHILKKVPKKAAAQEDSTKQSDNGFNVTLSKSTDSIDDVDCCNEFEVTLAQHHRKNDSPSSASQPQQQQHAGPFKSSGSVDTSKNTAKTTASSAGSTGSVRQPASVAAASSGNMDSQVSFSQFSNKGSEDSVAASSDTIFMEASQKGMATSKAIPTMHTKHNGVSTSASARSGAKQGSASSKQSTVSRKRPLPNAEPADSDVSIPWSGIKLRSVRDPDRSASSDASVPSAWAKVKLRHVKGKPQEEKIEVESSVASSAGTIDDSATVAKAPTSATTATSAQPTKHKQTYTPMNFSGPKTPANAPRGEGISGAAFSTFKAALKPTQGVHKPNPASASTEQTATSVLVETVDSPSSATGPAKLSPSLVASESSDSTKDSVGPSVDSAAAVAVDPPMIRTSHSGDDATKVSSSVDPPADNRPNQEEPPSEVSVPLKKSADDAGDAGTDVTETVRVNQTELVKLQSQGGQPETVIWRLKPESIRSMTFDIVALRVRLLLADEHSAKDLLFDSKHDYLVFSKALHDLSSSTEPLPQAAAAAAAASPKPTVVEHLNAEEREVLEAYRKRRMSHPASHADLVDAMQNRRSAPFPLSTSIPTTTVEAGSSPTMSAVSAMTELSEGEAKQVETYRKMLKMRIPIEAVRHKMTKEDVSINVIQAVLNEGSAAPNAGSASQQPKNDLTKEDLEHVGKFKKMLKMRIPPEAVEHKMRKEGMSTKIMDAVLDRASSGSDVEATDGANKPAALSPEDQKKVDSYKKMLKMCIPAEAVEHKMRKEGVKVELMEVVLGKSMAAPNSSGKPTGVTLTDAEESIATSYRQMLKLKIPKEGVRHRMQKEGVSAKIIAAVLGDKVKDNSASEPAKKKRRALKPGFHWNPLSSGQQLANSIWGKLRTSPIPDDCSEISCVTDISKHVEKFQKPTQITQAAKKTVTTTAGGEKIMAKLIDLNRANNVAISLQAYKEFSRAELGKIIEFVDPKKRLVDERVQFMKDLLPAPAEAKMVKGYSGADDRLVPAELWFKQIAHVERADAKVGVLKTMGTFKNEADEICKSFRLLITVCNQVMSSIKLPDLLDVVRQIGNIMNEGRGEEVAGFKLDFLSRLAQTKGSDKKTSALDLIVMIFAERNQQNALLLSDDFPDCQSASKIQLSDLLGDVRSMSAAMRRCKREREALVADGKPPAPDTETRSEPLFAAEMRKRAGNQTEAAGGNKNGIIAKRTKFLEKMKASKQEMAAKGSSSTVAELLKSATKPKGEGAPAISPRASLRASMKAKLNPEREERAEYTREDGVKRIDDFLEEANAVYSALESERDNAVQACRNLSEFFCEPGGENKAASLLAILAEFAGNLNSALKKHKERQEILRRKEAVRKKKLQASVSRSLRMPSNKPPKPEDMVGNAKNSGQQSLVLMVYEMCKTAGDDAVDDFKKGVIHDDTSDDRLKKIYEAEQIRKAEEKLQGNGLKQMAKLKRVTGSDQASDAGSSSSTNVSPELANALANRSSLKKTGSRKAPRPEGGSQAVQRRERSDGAQESPALVEAATFDSVQEGKDKRNAALSRWTTPAIVQSGTSDSDEVVSIATTDVETREHALASKRMALMSRWVQNAPVSEDGSTDDANTEVDLDEAATGADAETESLAPLRQTDSEILAADSEDMEEVKMAEKRRQSYLDRWVRKPQEDDKETVASDVESVNEIADSEVGVSTAEEQRRQTLIARWMRKMPEDEDSDEDLSMFGLGTKEDEGDDENDDEDGR